jgi:hypothetical protein
LCFRLNVLKRRSKKNGFIVLLKEVTDKAKTLKKGATRNNNVNCLENNDLRIRYKNFKIFQKAIKNKIEARKIKKKNECNVCTGGIKSRLREL